MTTNPTSDLLNFYKNKAIEYDQDIKQLGIKLDSIKKNLITETNFWNEVKEKNNEIFHLQAVMNKMEMCLLKEKENSLRLSAENDILRIKDIENKNRLKELENILFGDKKDKIKMSQKTNNSHVDDTSGYISQSHTSNSSNNLQSNEKEKHFLMLQVKALKIEIEEQRRFITINMEKIITKNQDYELRFKNIMYSDSEKSKNLLHRLVSTQELLCQTAKDLADLKRIYHKNEEIYKIKEQSLCHKIKEFESQSQYLQSSSNIGHNKPLSKHSMSEANLAKLPKKEKLLDEKIRQFDATAKIYKDKFLELETQHEILREQFEADHKIYKERNESLLKRLEAAETKYDNLLKRKNFDRQGYQADIAIMRDKVKQLERLLYKATMNLNNDGKNREILENMAKIAEESKKMIENETKSRLELLELEEKLTRLN